VKIHIETPYRKSNTRILRNQQADPLHEEEGPKTNTKRQLFQLMPFPKLVSSRKPRKQRVIGTKRNGQSKTKTMEVQKRDHVVQDDGTRVPFFAESNLGIVHNRHKEESFETFEKKHNILKIQKRAISGWGTYGNVARGTVHGQVAEKNPILQLLRSAAGKKTQKILGLNSKSFDIFPGPLPEESANLAKAQSQASLTRMHYPSNDQMITRRPYQTFFRGGRQQYRSFHGRNQPYDYPQTPMMSPTRRGIRPRAIEMGPPAQPENYPVNTEQMLRRGNLYDPPQQYITQQRVPRQSFVPPISQTLPEPSGVNKEDFYQPNEVPNIRSNFDRYSSSLPLPANGMIQNGETQQQEKLIEDQINQINQDEGAQDQHNLISRQEFQSILSPANGLTQLPKVNDQGSAPFLAEDDNLQYNKGYQPLPQPSYFMNRPQPQRQFEEDEQALRRRVVPTVEENPRTRLMPQYYQGQQFNPMVNEGPNIITHHHSRTLERERQPANDTEDDEEKPEVHVHISTEKRKKIAKPENSSPSKVKEMAKSQAKD